MKLGIVTGKSGNTLVKYLVGLGHEVYVITGDYKSGGGEHAKAVYYKYFIVADDSTEEYKKICNWLVDKGIDGFILGTGVWFAHEIAFKLNKEYGVSISHNVDYLGVFKNKFKTKELFAKFGLMSAKHQFLTTKIFNFELEPPFVVKNNIDLFPVWLCHSIEEFLTFQSKTSDSIWTRGVLLEEYIEGNDLTIPVFARVNSVDVPCLVYWSKQANYKLEGFGDLTQDRIPVEVQQKLLKECKLMIEDLGYFGVCRFDVRVSKEEYYYLEINSVVSIRDEGSSFKAMKEVGINYVERAMTVYLDNILYGLNRG